MTAPIPDGRGEVCHVAPPSDVKATKPGLLMPTVGDVTEPVVTPDTQQSRAPAHDRLVINPVGRPMGARAVHVAPPSVEVSTVGLDPRPSVIARQDSAPAHDARCSPPKREAAAGDVEALQVDPPFVVNEKLPDVPAPTGPLPPLATHTCDDEHCRSLGRKPLGREEVVQVAPPSVVAKAKGLNLPTCTSEWVAVAGPPPPVTPTHVEAEEQTIRVPNEAPSPVGPACWVQDRPPSVVSRNQGDPDESTPSSTQVLASAHEIAAGPGPDSVTGSVDGVHV